MTTVDTATLTAVVRLCFPISSNAHEQEESTSQSSSTTNNKDGDMVAETNQELRETISIIADLVVITTAFVAGFIFVFNIKIN